MKFGINVKIAQSCAVSRNCRKLLNKVLKYPVNSRLAALFNQEAFLLSHDQHTSLTSSANSTLLETEYEVTIIIAKVASV